MYDMYDDQRTDKEKGLLPKWMVWPLSILIALAIIITLFGTISGGAYLYNDHPKIFAAIIAGAGMIAIVMFTAFIVKETLFS